jgi:hypothetical protein
MCYIFNSLPFKEANSLSLLATLHLFLCLYLSSLLAFLLASSRFSSVLDAIIQKSHEFKVVKLPGAIDVESVDQMLSN